VSSVLSLDMIPIDVKFLSHSLCCCFRRGPGGKFVPPVLNRNASDDDGWAV